MNKTILIVIFCFISFCSKSQNKINFEKTLKIEHFYGDESYEVEEMEFYTKEDKVYGKIVIPNKDVLLNSEVKLSKSDINLLNSFLKFVDKYKNDCEEKYQSSYIQNYTIIKDSKEVKIYKFCDWKNFTYFDIKQKIFGNYLKDLKKEEQNLNNQISSLLAGYWEENTFLEALKFDTLFIAKKVDKETLNEFIEFKKNNKMSIHRNNKIVYYKFRIDVVNNEKYINLFGDDEKNGEEFIYGHRFLIIALNENEIKLKRS